MSMKAGGLYYDLELNDKSFRQTLDKSEKSLKDFSSKFDKLGKKMTSVGKGMTAGVTLPILGIGGALIKAASDAEEMNSKFDAVFKEQSKSVRDWVKVYSDSVGRSEQNNIRFLSSIQDTLVPLGYMRDDAADMSKEILKLSTDLASFNNMPTEEVIRGVNSALVGNVENLRRYGIVANEASIEQEALTTGIWDGEGALTAQEKAQAIYQIAVKGSEDAMGDATRTADSFANQFVALKGDTKDLAAELGEELLPIALDVVQMLKGMVEDFSNLSDEEQRSALKTMGLVAAIGPLLLVGGKTITMVVGLTNAIRTMRATSALATTVLSGPGALIAATVALGIAAGESRRRMIENGEAIQTAAGQAVGMHGEVSKIKRETSDAYRAAEQMANRYQAMAEDGRYLADEMQRVGSESYDAEEQATIMGLRYQAMAEDLGVATQELKKQTDELTLQERMRKSYKEFWSDVNQQWESIGSSIKYNSELVENIAESEEYTKEQKRRYLEDLKQQYELTPALLEQASKFPVFDEQRRGILEEINALMEEYADTSGDAAAEQAELERAEAKRKRKQEERLRIQDDFMLAQMSSTDREIEMIEREADTYIKAGVEKVDVEKWAQAQIDEVREETHKKQTDRIQSELQQFSGYMSDIGSIVSNMEQTRKNAIQSEYDAQRQALYDEYADKKKNADDKEAVEEEYNKEVAKLNYEQKLEEWRVEKDLFKAKQAANTASIIMETGLAIMKAWSQLGPIGAPIATGIISALAASQLALISSQPLPPKPTPPELAEGGLIQSSTGGTTAVIGEGKYDEAVLPLSDDVYERLSKGIMNETTNNNNYNQGPIEIHVHYPLGEEVIYEIAQEGLDNRKIRIPQ